MSNTKSRLSAESVNRRADELKQATETRFAGVEQQIDEAMRHVNYWETEGKRRHSGTSAQTSRTVAELKQLKARFEHLTRELADIKSSDNPIIAQGNLADLESINNRLEAFEELPDKVRKLREDVSELQATVIGHGARITNVEEEVVKTNGSLGRLTHRVFNLENIQEKAPWAALLIGIVAGVIAYFMWFNLVPWKSVIELADGTEIPVTYDALHFGGSWLVAIATGALIAGLIIAYFRKRPATYRDDDVAPVQANTANPSPAPRRIAEDDAPTKVLVTEGAQSGTR